MKLTEHNEQVLNRFSHMMIERMNQMKESNWEKGWFGVTKGGSPMNLEGRNYKGCNVPLLMLDCCMQGFEYPIYCTLKQANRIGAHINKGACSMPIIFWDFMVYDKDGKKLDYKTYTSMDRPEREKCKRIPFLKSYNVFNIQQTNIAEKHPEKYQELIKNFVVEDITDSKGMYANSKIDSLLEQQNWVCPIRYDKPSDSAFYQPTGDFIIVPMKTQFKKHRKRLDIYTDGQEFYSTLLHEMIHSTGIESRLNREQGSKFGTKKYAKEELVAELGAARVGCELGFHSKVIDNNAAYLDSWIKTLSEEPTFIFTVMTDVEKAARMILDRLGIVG